MKAEIIRADRDFPDAKLLQKAGEVIRAGGLVAFPTETVYGLGGDALAPGAAKKIYAAKGRPSDNQLIVHIALLEALEKIVKEIPPRAELLYKKFWPGPLTLIFKKSGIVPAEVTGGLNTVAVRFPSHSVAQGFIEAAGGYVAAPSANLSGRPSPTKAAHVIEDLGDRIDMIIDSGDCDIGLESSIVDFSSDTPALLRPGYISAEQIRDTIGELRTDCGTISEDSAEIPKAPGMKYRHYAPKGEMIIVEGDKSSAAGAINRLVKDCESSGKRAAVLCCEENRHLYSCKIIVSPGHASNGDEVAQRLFSSLRELDRQNAEFIYSEPFNTERSGEAIMNRLLKAAGHKVINV